MMVGERRPTFPRLYHGLSFWNCLILGTGLLLALTDIGLVVSMLTINLTGRPCQATGTINRYLRELAPASLASVSYGWEGPSDKLEQLKTLSLYCASGNGFVVPSFTDDLQTALQWLAATPSGVWGRKRQHSRGRDIAIFESRPRHWRMADFWVQQITNIVDEWRIHVVGERAVHWARKVPATLDEQLPLPVIRSRRNGYVLVRDKDAPPTVYRAAIAAVKALGQSHGAVDILEVREGLPVVLEVNFRPRVDERTARCYARAIIREATE